MLSYIRLAGYWRTLAQFAEETDAATLAVEETQVRSKELATSL
jgi:hypothetical protein